MFEWIESNWQEKVRVKRKGIPQDIKNHLNESAALYKSQVFQRFQRGNVSIYNHREDAEEPAEDTKPQFHSIFCLRKIFSKNVLGKKKLFI